MVTWKHIPLLPWLLGHTYLCYHGYLDTRTSVTMVTWTHVPLLLGSFVGHTRGSPLFPCGPARACYTLRGGIDCWRGLFSPHSPTYALYADGSLSLTLQQHTSHYWIKAILKMYFLIRTPTKWKESGSRPPLCTYRLNWARRTSWGW